MKLYTVMTSSPNMKQPLWMSVNFDHPANFDTLAMDTDIKERVMKCLERFIERSEYYRRFGKA